MLSIGDFSRLGQVTVRTLRLYDELGLLKPARVDDANGYRYYSVDQLPRLNRILVLKGMGFSLEQITYLIEGDLPVDQLRGMFMMKQAEIEQEMQENEMRLKRVAARLRQIEQEGQLPHYEVMLKSVEPLKIVSARQVIPTGDDMLYYRRILFSLVHHCLKQTGVESPGHELAIYHNTEYVEREIDVEAAVMIDPCALKSSPSPLAVDGVAVRELPAVENLASVIHHGGLSNCEQAMIALSSWIGENGWSIMGPCREIHLSGSELETGGHKPVIIELQFPVERRRVSGFGLYRLMLDPR
jgi:DNA-binding transcriptional MerR regulator